jgi:hypothetical protein
MKYHTIAPVGTCRNGDPVMNDGRQVANMAVLMMATVWERVPFRDLVQSALSRAAQIIIMI